MKKLTLLFAIILSISTFAQDVNIVDSTKSETKKARFGAFIGVNKTKQQYFLKENTRNPYTILNQENEIQIEAGAVFDYSFNNTFGMNTELGIGGYTTRFEIGDEGDEHSFKVDISSFDIKMNPNFIYKMGKSKKNELYAGTTVLFGSSIVENYDDYFTCSLDMGLGRVFSLSGNQLIKVRIHYSYGIYGLNYRINNEDGRRLGIDPNSSTNYQTIRLIFSFIGS